MIKEQEVLDLGFRIFGIEENDPYYKIILNNSVFGVQELVGNFKDDGFHIWGMGKTFTDIEDLKLMFLVNGFEINYEITNKYGSDEPILNQENEDKEPNSKKMSKFILEMYGFANKWKEENIVIQAPNGEYFPPVVKMQWDDTIKMLEEDPKRMVVTFG